MEGECHELAAFGYSRDQKPGQAQIVMGLMTMADGEPIAVHVCDGNTSDPLTVPAPVEKLRTRFGITEVVFVGDRGMVKTKGQAALATAGYKYITARTTPQGRKLLREGVVRPEWLTPHVHEVQHGSVRLVLHRSEAVRRKAQRRRHDKLAKLYELITARNACVRTAKRAQPEAGRRTLHAWVTRHKLAGWVQWSLQEGAIIATVDEVAQTAATVWDGCSVFETDVPQTVLEAQAVHDRYQELPEVEQDVRTMNTALLEVRPVFVRQAPHTRAHVLVTMFALKVVREMRRALVAAFGTTDDDRLAVTVDDALAALSRLCLLIYQVRGTAISRLPSPDARQAAILNALGTPLPDSRSVRMM